MNEKQAKLLRYFERYTGKKDTVKQLKKVFDLADHRTKGTITRFLRRMCAIQLATRKQALDIETSRLRDMFEEAATKALAEHAALINNAETQKEEIPV